MGDAESKPASEDAEAGGGATQRENAEKLFESFQNQKINAKDAFEQAYADTPGAFQGISALAQQIGSSGKHVAPGDAKSAGPVKAKADAKEERRNRAVARKAESEADQWLEQQLSKAKHAEQARKRPAQPTQPLQKRPQPPREPEKHQPPKAQQAQECEQSQRPTAGNLASATDGGASKEPAAPIVADEGLADDVGVRLSPLAPVFGDALSSMRLPMQLPEPVGDEIPTPLADAEPTRPVKEEAQQPPAGVPLPEFYQLLGIGMDATFEEVRKGYRKQALLWHPDKNRYRLPEATARFQRINEAFDTLFDPQKRAAYDEGKIRLPGRAKKLQGHGWSKVSDEDDATLTPYGAKIKKQSWSGYIYFGGRIDDEDPIRDPDSDPRTPMERVKVFWRYIGEKAYEARDEGDPKTWLQDFIEEVWKDTPSRWPGAQALQGMSDASREEWKERRMVFNRRRQKVLIHVSLHEDYLAIPNREQKEKERLRKIWPSSIKN